MDEKTAMLIMELLQQINDLGTTVMVATHNEGLVDKLGKRRITLDKGRVVADREGDGKK